jgi:V/A-type H+-transporting ATPase subunit D
MAEIKFTKNELRNQQVRLAQLEKYLPTLQLKKAMLQAQANEVRAEIQALRDVFQKEEAAVRHYSSLLLLHTVIDPKEVVKIVKVDKHYENIAGVEIPYFDGVTFADVYYDLFETPPWMDAAFRGLRNLVESNIKVEIAEEKKRAIEKELREVSIRVNLFEKVMIPRAIECISQIKVFLGDQQLAAVSRAKVAKSKKERRKKLCEAQGE